MIYNAGKRGLEYHASPVGGECGFKRGKLRRRTRIGQSKLHAPPADSAPTGRKVNVT
jgi:hypothetical protein